MLMLRARLFPPSSGQEALWSAYLVLASSNSVVSFLALLFRIDKVRVSPERREKSHPTSAGRLSSGFDQLHQDQASATGLRFLRRSSRSTRILVPITAVAGRPSNAAARPTPPVR